MIGVGWNAVIVRGKLRDGVRSLRADLNELKTDLDELNTDLNELNTRCGTDKRTIDDSTLADLKNANAVEIREVSAKRKMQGRFEENARALGESHHNFEK